MSTPGLFATWCCCMIGLSSVLSRSTLVVVLRVLIRSLLTWVSRCRVAHHGACPTCRSCCYCGVGLRRTIWDRISPIVDRVNTWVNTWRSACQGCLPPADIESVGQKGGGVGRSFIFVDFNAWEYVGSEVLWAALITKIFEKVSFFKLSLSGRATRLRIDNTKPGSSVSTVTLCRERLWYDKKYPARFDATLSKQAYLVL